MQIMRFRGHLEVSDTVGEVKGAKHHALYAKEVAEQGITFEPETPDNVQLSFHNSVRGFDFGGWTTGNYPTKTDQASLFINDGLQGHRFNLAPRKSGLSLFGVQLGGESVKDFVARAIQDALKQLPELLKQVSRTEMSEWRGLKVGHMVYEATMAAGEQTHRTGQLYSRRHALFRSDTEGVVALNTPEVLDKIEDNLLAKGFKLRPDMPHTPDRRSLVFSNVAVELRNSNQYGSLVGRVGNDGYYIETMAERLRTLFRNAGVTIGQYASPRPAEGKLMTLNWDQLGLYKPAYPEALAGSVSHGVIIADREQLDQLQMILVDHGFVSDEQFEKTSERRMLVAPDDFNAGQHKVELRTRASVEQDEAFKQRIVYS